MNWLGLLFKALGWARVLQKAAGQYPVAKKALDDAVAFGDVFYASLKDGHATADEKAKMQAAWLNLTPSLSALIAALPED